MTRGATKIHGVINFGDDKLSIEKLAAGTRIIINEMGGASIFESSHVKRRALWAMLGAALEPNRTNAEKMK